jgi:hypothetical protein
MAVSTGAIYPTINQVNPIYTNAIPTSPGMVYNLPTYPFAGQTAIDHNGNTWIWDGRSWQPCYNNQYQQPVTYHGHNSHNTFDNDITMINSEGKIVSIKNSLKRIMEILGIIEPDYDLIDKYPAVKAAYEEYTNQLEKIMVEKFPELHQSIKSYKVITAIARADNSQEK